MRTIWVRVRKKRSRKKRPALSRVRRKKSSPRATRKRSRPRRPNLKPRWIPLADTLDQFKQHWKTDDTRGTIYYDQEKKQIDISSVWNMGLLHCPKPWKEFEFQVLMTKPGGFELEINGITLDFGRVFVKPPKSRLVQVKYHSESSLVAGSVDGDVVSKATVLNANWSDRFRCLISKPGGAQCVLSISKIRLLTMRANE